MKHGESKAQVNEDNKKKASLIYHKPYKMRKYFIIPFTVKNILATSKLTYHLMPVVVHRYSSCWMLVQGAWAC